MAKGKKGGRARAHGRGTTQTQAPLSSAVIKTLKLANQHHQAGDLPKAEQLYRHVLSADPTNVDANHLLGLIAHHVGKFDIAIEFINKALAIQPNSAVA